MNHLAHVWLAPGDRPLWRVGSLLGDFARECDFEALPAEVRLGVAHHRAIDAFTDTHPVFRRSKRRVAATRSRVAGILVDVFYDHFLARDWHHHGGGTSLSAFARDYYELLRRHAALLPATLRAALPRMIERDWLAICLTTDGVQGALARLETRLRRPLPLALGAADLAANYDALAADFAEFAPDVIAFARGFALDAGGE